jgi:hypothetical protein
LLAYSIFINMTPGEQLLQNLQCIPARLRRPAHPVITTQQLHAVPYVEDVMYETLGPDSFVSRVLPKQHAPYSQYELQFGMNQETSAEPIDLIAATFVEDQGGRTRRLNVMILLVAFSHPSSP